MLTLTHGSVFVPCLDLKNTKQKTKYTYKHLFDGEIVVHKQNNNSINQCEVYKFLIMNKSCDLYCRYLVISLFNKQKEITHAW